MTVIPPSDDLLTLADIARRIPGARGARRLHPATITRWILKGTRATDGTVVRLRATRVGHRWLVCLVGPQVGCGRECEEHDHRNLPLHRTPFLVRGLGKKGRRGAVAPPARSVHSSVESTIAREPGFSM